LITPDFRRVDGLDFRFDDEADFERDVRRLRDFAT
jgi:hypothetical protein